LNTLLTKLPEERQWQLVPPGVWMMLILAMLVAGLLRYTRIGRHIFALGSNEQTARLCGVPVNRTKTIVYMLCSTFAALAGILQFSYLTMGDPTTAEGKELDTIAAVVIGGGSLAGGEGSVLGSLVGALIMTVIDNGCTKLELPNWVQQIVTGLIIVTAVALDRLRHRRVES
jgi:ribose/xylose/arabinose/galactoside ABC-type transport system permease subunit